jgi:hypothetical protein
VTLHPVTLDMLQSQGRVGEALKYYGVTHIIGYDDAHTKIIKRVDPRIEIVTIPEYSSRVTVTPLMQYILHQIR